MVGIEAFPVLLSFVGPVEMMILFVVVLVLVFGAKAPDMAAKAGSSVGKVARSKQHVEQEIEDIKGTPEELRKDMGIDEDLDEIQESVEDLERSADPDADVTESTERSSTPED